MSESTNGRSGWGAWAGRQAARRGIPLLILAGVVAGAYWYWPGAASAPSAERPAAPASAVPVTTVVIEERDAPIRPTFLGQTEPSQIVQIRARVSGVLEERAFEEGQKVAADQVLFRIDPEPFKIDLQQAEAALESAEARVTRANQELRRARVLGRSGAQAEAEVEQAQEESRIAAAEVSVQKAQIARSKLELDYSTIESPITGVIGRSEQDVGSYIDPASNGQLAVVRQVDPMYVRYSVSERDMLRWQRLQESGRVTPTEPKEIELEITLADGRVFPHKGRINFVDVRIDPATGSAVIRGTVPNPEGTLRPGQFVHATALGVVQHGTLTVPQKAVLQLPLGSSVYVVNAENVVELRPVKLGEWSGDDWIVEEGLKPGDRVVTDRLMQVRPGMAVQPLLADDPNPSGTNPKSEARTPKEIQNRKPE